MGARRRAAANARSAQSPSGRTEKPTIRAEAGVGERRIRQPTRPHAKGLEPRLDTARNPLMYRSGAERGWTQRSGARTTACPDTKSQRPFSHERRDCRRRCATPSRHTRRPRQKATSISDSERERPGVAARDDRPRLVAASGALAEQTDRCEPGHHRAELPGSKQAGRAAQPQPSAKPTVAIGDAI